MTRNDRVGFGNDYFSNSSARTGWGTPSLTEATEYNLVRLTYDYWLMITLYQNHWICRKIVDVPAQDMIRAWPTITSEIDPKDLARINKALRKTKTQSDLLQTLKWARLFGGAGALMVIDGQENILDEPLDLESIEIGAFRGLIPFDRWAGIMPSDNVCDDINRPLEFNLPEHYRIQSTNGAKSFEVHASRILRFTGPAVPTPEYQAMNYWGISVLEPAFEEIRKRDNVSWNIVSLTFRANLIGMVFPELAQMLSGLGSSAKAAQSFYDRMMGINHLMSNQSMIMLPKEGDMKSISYGFSGLSEVLQQFQLDIAGASGIPVARLYGRTVSGLGQTGDGDERIYEEMIAAEQADRLLPQLDKLFPVICMSCLGEVPEDLDLKFPSVRVLDEKEKSDLAKSTSDSIVSVFNAGIINRPQALRELKQLSDATGVYTNLTDDDIDAADEAEKLTSTLQLENGKQGKDEPRDTTTKRSPGAGDSDDSFDIEFAGIPLTIEVPAGERRQIFNADGELVYDKLLRYDYGEIRGTRGRDGDPVDVIVGNNEDATEVYIVHMVDFGEHANILSASGNPDEYKVLLGFDNKAAARAAFLSMYDDRSFGGILEVPLEDFTSKDSRYGAALDAKFEESKHQRNANGQFAFSAGDRVQLNPKYWKPTPSKMDHYHGTVMSAGMGATNTGKKSRSYRIKSDDDHRREKAGELNEWGNPFVARGTPFLESELIPSKRKNPYAGDAADDEIDDPVEETGEDAEWEESKHPRGQPGNSGQFGSGGGHASQPGENRGESQHQRGGGTNRSSGGTGAKGESVTSPKDFKLAAQASIRPYDESKFRKARASEKTPGGWTNVKVNPDPKADVEMVGVNQYGKPSVKYSASFYAKQKVEREKWPAWAKKAKIPMPWTEIKLAPSPDSSHILATGIDAVGVRKAIYSPNYVENQTKQKHERVKELDSHIDKVYAKIEKDGKSSDDEVQQHAQCGELILKYGLRPGGSSIQRGSVKSYGAIDLESKHVVRDGRNGKLYLRFTGKKGQSNEFLISDPNVEKWLVEAKERADRPASKGWQSYEGFLFPWVKKSSLQRYSNSLGSDNSKDFRTRVGTNYGKQFVAELKAPKTAQEFKKQRQAVGYLVSKKLCNTRAVALSAYINREVFKGWVNGLSKDDQALVKW